MQSWSYTSGNCRINLCKIYSWKPTLVQKHIQSILWHIFSKCWSMWACCIMTASHLAEVPGSSLHLSGKCFWAPCWKKYGKVCSILEESILWHWWHANKAWRRKDIGKDKGSPWNDGLKTLPGHTHNLMIYSQSCNLQQSTHSLPTKFQRLQRFHSRQSVWYTFQEKICESNRVMIIAEPQLLHFLPYNFF